MTILKLGRCGAGNDSDRSLRAAYLNQRALPRHDQHGSAPAPPSRRCPSCASAGSGLLPLSQWRTLAPASGQPSLAGSSGPYLPVVRCQWQWLPVTRREARWGGWVPGGLGPGLGGAGTGGSGTVAPSPGARGLTGATTVRSRWLPAGPRPTRSRAPGRAGNSPRPTSPGPGRPQGPPASTRPGTYAANRPNLNFKLANLKTGLLFRVPLFADKGMERYNLTIPLSGRDPLRVANY
jgi:hypothetical protein